MRKFNQVSLVAMAFAIGVTGSTAGFAQTSPAAADESGDSSEIIVTARKRDETLLQVPVVVTAVAAETLDNRGITNLDGISRVVPQLMIGPQGGAVQGGNISIRGIAGPDSNPFGDQAVSFMIDGVQVSKANVRRMSDTDISQVEVLKGPQALFYGKNSMAGIVNIRTADPGDHLEAKISAGYETEAQEIRTEGYISAPLTDKVGVRVSGIYSTMKGYLTDDTPSASNLYQGGHNPDSDSYALRGTLKFDASDNFDVRLKMNFGQVKGNGPAAITAFISCPVGVRQTGGGAQCVAGSHNVNAGYGNVVGTIPGTLNHFRTDGHNFTTQKQQLHGLEMNYHLSDALTMTSVTGYYRVKLDQCQNYENDYSIVLPSCNVLSNREISEDFHITSDYDGPLNFTVGAYYAKTKATTGSITYLFGNGFDLFNAGTPGAYPLNPDVTFGGLAAPAQVNNYLLTQKGTAMSAFLEMSYKPVEKVEINAGVRYSREKKRLTDVRGGGGIAEGTPLEDMKTILDDTTLLTVANGALALDNDSWSNWSPEGTISYHPSDDLTLFASYKQGFLSGGFNSSSVNFSVPNLDLSYRPQTIKGFEGGVKARLADGALFVNLAAYTYTIADLQVTNFTNSTSTIRNAAGAKVKGIEFDFNYKTPLQGLSLHGAAAYNKGTYSSFPAAPCYNGQTPAQGCDLVGGNPQQDLAGHVLPRAPKLNASAGFNYESLIGDSLKLGVSGDLTHSSSYLTDATDAPNGRQPSYTLIDGSVRVGTPDDRWELALVGRNLTNKFYFVSSTDVPFTGSGTGTAGGALGDRFGGMSRGREVLIRGTFKY